MRLAERIAKNCCSRPPSNLNLDNLEPHTDQVISTLWDAKEALIGCEDNMAVAIATYRALDRHWSSIWPWMLALSRGLLNQAAPSTPSELTNTKRLALMLSILLAYPVYNPANWRHSDAACTVPENVLDSLIQSHPSILVLFTKIWLLADELELGDIILASLTEPITLISENSTKSAGKFGGTRILEDKPRDELEAIFTETNFDLPGALLN
ncbi:hypothetical protein PQX77_020307 [Marasmius sp. AFHP31]|nr:hypothetical protein PQX77_020307 [Marasmius sp. AFHP31]